VRTARRQAKGSVDQLSRQSAKALELGARAFRRLATITALDQRETFLEEALFMPQSIRADELVRDFHAPSGQLLSFAVSHELGHVICSDGSESAANRIAEQLRSGKYPECVNSLTPIDELYLHSHMSGFPHFQ
jgi:hypothetical protein